MFALVVVVLSRLKGRLFKQQNTYKSNPITSALFGNISMSDLTIIRLKPNPAGKDKTRSGSYAPNHQLNAEWIDIKNTSGKNLLMKGVKVCDHTFGLLCGDNGRRVIFAFSDWTMPANAIVRIHSGKQVDVSQMAWEDRNGADYHAFTSGYYVWNNMCGDIAEILTVTNSVLDKASYSRYPLEGKVLVRTSAEYLV